MHHNPLSQFNIYPITAFYVLGKKIILTNLALFALIATALFILCFYWAANGLRAKPNKRQAALETLHEFIVNMVDGTIGLTKGRKFVPLIFSFFVFILLCNLCGMLPYSFAITSHITTTFALAMVLFVIMIFVGFIYNGLSFFKIFAPKGCPIWLMPLMIVIEMFSFLSKPISLSLRLAANITSGHILLHIIAGFAASMWLIAKLVPFAFMILIFAFELGVCILQAYIFTILACVYLNDVLESH